MKKYLLVSILFLLPCLVFAQNKKSIDGFMDIPFGSDSATVKAAVLAKGGKQDHALSEKDELVFTDFPLSQRKVTSFIVKFTSNKAFDAFFYFDYDDSVILDSYDGFVADIAAVYGKPAETDNFNDLNNTTKIRKLRSGNIVVKTLWQAKDKSTIAISIIPIASSLQIMLRYGGIALFLTLMLLKEGLTFNQF